MNNHQKTDKTEITLTNRQAKLSFRLFITVRLVDCFENSAYSFTKRIILSFCFVCILPYFVFGQQNRWLFVGNDVAGTAFYLEKDSPKSIGKIIRVWTKNVYTDGSFQINQIDWDCKEKKYFVIQSSNYFSDGRLLNTLKGDVWLDVFPDALSETMYKAVCKTSLAGNYGKTSSIYKTAEIIVKKANLRAEPNAYSRVIRQAVTGERFVLVSESPEKGWYQIIDVESNETVWIYGSNIKLIEVTKTSKTEKNKETKITKRKSAN